ncbi:unnamed protein product [Kluyveromyces dobzhanskii CBS 2104]|uniref:WGS project CCBQ000000000 data, contig 00105 n=1 Tax=Kluyveromyces dobzhanskii CBS 2104 TaxID=1427455 RepID=A0A0A8KZ64_9SACH|nr:unnamed protein product [Kluyveromyces dobzhanskii CBS 2104]
MTSQPDFYKYDDCFSLLPSAESQEYVQVTPLTPLFENYEKARFSETSSVEKRDDDLEYVPRKCLLNDLISSRPVTIDFNDVTEIRQIVTQLPPFGEFQIVTRYELSPLAGIIKEIEDVNSQILFYFSTDNLLRDIYLRSLMGKDGFLLIRTFSEFPRIKKLLPKLTMAEQKTKVLKNAFKLSEPELFEIVGDMVRLRDSWERWVLPHNR